MNIKKLSLLLICCFFLSCALGSQSEHVFSNNHASHAYKDSDNYFSHSEDLIDFEGVNTQQHIDTEALIKWWVPVASGFTRPFFILYSKFYAWWIGSSSKRFVNR